VARSTDLKAAASAEPPVASTLAAAALLLLILVDAIGFAMLTPLLASALADGSDAGISKGLSATQRHLVYGIAPGLCPIVTFFGAPILGQLSDRLGRKAILLVCATGIAASYVVISAAFAWGSTALLMAGPDCALLTIPPLLWYGVQGLAPGVSIIANCSDLPNDPAESDCKPVDAADVPYRWPAVAA
jgi:MFS family permease